MSLSSYHSSKREQERVSDLMALVPDRLTSALDIGARDGYIARKLADRVGQVTALDLQRPVIDDQRVSCVEGNATALDFPSNSFDLVFCAEVLEHIPSPGLERACSEIARVSRRFALIGVPFKQDLRHGSTRCQSCGKVNPPWGHVNSFDENRLMALFSAMTLQRQSMVGIAEPGTNALSAWLMHRAGHPYGTYEQDEACISCGGQILPPPSRRLDQRLYTRAAVLTRQMHLRFMTKHANWIHMLLVKPG